LRASYFLGCSEKIGVCSAFILAKSINFGAQSARRAFRMAVRMLVFMTFYDLTTKHIRLTYEETFMDGVAMLSFFDASPNGSEA
jgi:hypothetical protein